MKRTLVAAGLAVIATALVACGSSHGSTPAPAHQRAAAAAGTVPTLPSTPPNPIGNVPVVAAPPNVTKAEQGVQAALAELSSAAGAVFAAGSQSSLSPATNAFSSQLGVVQKQSSLAFSAGQSGQCAASFTASRAADAALRPTRAGLAKLGRQVGEVHRARAKYGVARTHALSALQQLYNAIAGHPLSTGPSSVVDQLRSAITADDRATADAVTQASAVLNSAHQSMDSARSVAKQASLAPCLISS